MLWEINRNLEQVNAKLDRLIALFVLIQKRELDDARRKAIARSEVRREIYNLCDGTKTVQDIAKRLGKSLPHISKELAFLEEVGLVRPIEVGRKKYYERII